MPRSIRGPGLLIMLLIMLPTWAGCSDDEAGILVVDVYGDVTANTDVSQTADGEGGDLRGDGFGGDADLPTPPPDGMDGSESDGADVPADATDPGGPETVAEIIEDAVLDGGPEVDPGDADGTDGTDGADVVVVLQQTSCTTIAECYAAVADAGLSVGCVGAICDGGQCAFTEDARVGGACNDANVCTDADVCQADGTCAGTAQAACDCVVDGDCDAATGDDLCTTEYRCVAGGCEPDPAFRKVCFTGSDSFCSVTTCQPATGECVSQALNDAEACDLDNGCIDNPSCQAGLCSGTPKVCDDTDVCTFDSCDPISGTCQTTPLSGEPCDDGDNCTVVDVCALGQCGGTPQQCDDGVACSVDSCNPDTGACQYDDTACQCDPGLECDDDNPCTEDICDGDACVYAALTGQACDDGNLCTVADACGPSGFCQGPQKDCSDGIECTLDQCNQIDGQCFYQAGGCECVTNSQCDDEDPCTADACDLATLTCSHNITPNGDCDDGDACTVDDACQVDGSCVGGEKDCSDQIACTVDGCAQDSGECTHDAAGCEGCTEDTDCAETEPANLCVSDWVCDKTAAPFTCVPGPGAVVTCDGGSECQPEACDPATGMCVGEALDNGTPCAADNDPCTVGHTCQAGVCDVQMLSCDDELECTGDVCTEGGCQHVPLDAAQDFVSEGFGSGLPAGWAVGTDNAPVSWSTGPAWDGGGDGAGLGATGPGGTYDHGESTTTLSLPALWVHGSQVSLTFRARIELAEDAAFDSCFPTNDFFAVRLQANGSADIQVFCKATSHEGWATFSVDLSPFRDQQVALQFIFHANADTNDGFGVALDDIALRGEFGCDDGSACTTARCDAGTCATEGVACDDGNVCTADSCDGLSGECDHEVLVGAECEDGDACTTGEACLETGVCGGGAVDCEDGDACTADVCLDGECDHSPASGGVCDDEDPCTEADTCVLGECLGADKDCDDDNACTNDACVKAAGQGVCSYTQLSLVDCDDGDECSVDDTCFNGVCIGTDPGPSGPCGCQVASDCDDFEPDNLCVTQWQCVGGSCLPHPEGTVKCDDDMNPCTRSECRESTGICLTEMVDPGTPCDDGVACTLGDACFAGACFGGPECDDGNACTSGECVGGTCQYEAAADPEPTLAEDFDAGLPAGWTFESTNPGVSWEAAAGYEASDGSGGLVINGGAGYDLGAADVTATSGLFVPEGAKLSFQLSLQLAEETGMFDICIPDGTVDFVHVVVVLASGEEVGVKCYSNNTTGFGEQVIDLAAWDGQPLALRFRFFSNGMTNAPGFGAAIDDVRVIGAADCDDGDECTADVCDPGGGGCMHEAIPDCP